MSKVVCILWIDQAEYYFVCVECYLAEKHTQWSGSTQVPNFSEVKKSVYEQSETITNCELCNKKLGADKET